MTPALICPLAALSFVILFSSAAGAQNGDDPPLVAAEGGPWDAGPGFDLEKKTRRALSGIACPANASGQKLCLAVFDEGGEARHLVIGDGSYAVDNEPVILLPGDVELDLEAAAADDGFYYVAGSHSAKRKDCAQQSPQSTRDAAARRSRNRPRAARSCRRSQRRARRPRR